MITIRQATGMDKPRLIEMATRFLLESQYGELFDNQATPLSIGELVTNVLVLGAIFVAMPNPRQAAMKAQLEAMPDERDRMLAVMRMSTSQKAVLNFGDEYGPDKPPIVGMLAIVALPHPLTGTAVAEEIAWWVEPEHRGNTRIGPKMLRAAEAWATTKSANVVKMVAPAGSTVGKFYERMGYRPVETAYIKRV